MNYQYLEQLVAIDSPSGFTSEAIDFAAAALEELGYKSRRTNKGALVCSLGKSPQLGIAAHIDTLGAVVAGFTSEGNLRFSPLGGLSLTGFEGEYCRVRCLNGQVYEGTLLLDNPAVHANKDTGSKQRSLSNMHIRLDALVSSDKDARALGIEIGDIICFEPRYRKLPNGFIKSRFMDNKACCLVLQWIAEYYKNKNIPVELYFSNYEEVGHGAAPAVFSASVQELLVLDMGVVGDACEGQETHCSICAKDSTGPYDYGMRKRLVELAREEGIAYRQDVYPFYGSDGSAALRAGQDLRVALIGPGVSASHGVERTHCQGIEACFALCRAYIEDIL